MRTEPRELKSDWPEGTRFLWCGDDDTPLAVAPVPGGFRVFLPDGSERNNLCWEVPGALTREEFDRAAQAWAYDYTGWMDLDSRHRGKKIVKRTLKTNWPEGTKFWFPDYHHAPFALVPQADGGWQFFDPDGSVRTGWNCSSPPRLLTREEFDREAEFWAWPDIPFKTKWPDGTKFEFCASDETPLAFVPVDGRFWFFEPDGSERSALCKSPPDPISAEEFVRLAKVWASARHFLNTDWPEGTEFVFCGDDETPIALVPLPDGGEKFFLPDGSPRLRFCGSTPGRLTREEFDRRAKVWAAGQKR